MTQLQAAKTTRPMPLSADDLTVEWLEYALADHRGGSHVSGFEHQIIGIGEGLMGQLARVSITYNRPDINAPTSIIAKFASTNLKTREMARTQQYYEREIGFYNDIGMAVGIPTAHCYYSEHIQSSNHFVILLADLAPAVTSDQIVGTSATDGEWVIETAAKLHAKWWNSDQLANLDWAQPLTNTLSPEEGLAMITASIKQADELGSFDQYPEIKRLMKLLPPLFLMKPPQPFPFTLCHGDLRSDNVFCPSADGGDYALIDWQLSGIGQPAGDLARWFSQSITVEQRRATEQDLLKHYHQRLVDYGIRNYSHKQLIRDYQLNLVIILLMFSTNMDDIDQSPERVKQLFHKMLTRLDAALLDWKIINLLRVLPYLIPFLKFSSWLGSKFKQHSQKQEPII